MSILLDEGDIADLLGILARSDVEVDRRTCEGCGCATCGKHAVARRELKADIAEATAWIKARRSP